MSYALLDSLFATAAFGRKIAPIADHWAIRLQEYCHDLNTNRITPALWQEQVESLFRAIDLPDLLRFIEFERLQKGFQYPELGVATRKVVFPRLDGLPERTLFVKKIFGMKKDRAIIPHGHSNMASAHLVLKGSFQMRHYEKTGMSDTHLVVRPTIDQEAGIGACSSISDERDNIHWFVANTETAFTFDVIMLNLGEKPYDIQNIDIRDGEVLPDGQIRAPILDVETALNKYGREHH